MSKFVLLVETGADMPADMAAKYGVYTAPMHVSFGEETRDDGTFPVEDVYDFFDRTKVLTKTSGCTVGDFEKIYKEIRADHPDEYIIHLAYSAVTTCSYQSAVIAAEDDEKIVNVDTKHVSAGQSLVALMTARYIEENPEASVEDVVAKVEELSKKVCMGFFPGDLAYLRAGGRVSNAAYLGAKLLSLNPLIEILDGYLKATKKYVGKREKVFIQLLEEFPEKNNFSKDILAFVYSKGLKDSIRQQAQQMAEKMGYKEILWIQTGCVVTTHSGPGAFGICGISE